MTSSSPFIVGTGRCGTTLLRLMLDAHPQLAIPPETHFIPALISYRHRGFLRPRRAFLKAVTGAPFWLDNHLDESELKRRVDDLRPFNLSEALRLFYRLYAGSRGKPRWGDKTPFYVRHMLDIQKVLPEARFIHLIRDGRDVALSFKDLWFGPDSVDEAASRWVSWIKEARQQARALSGYMEIRYEDLILETETTLKRVCDFISLNWEPQMLDYHLTARERLEEMVQPLPIGDGRIIQSQDRKSIHALTDQPPARDRINVWKTGMRPSDKARFERIAGNLLRELGYEA